MSKITEIEMIETEVTDVTSVTTKEMNSLVETTTVGNDVADVVTPIYTDPPQTLTYKSGENITTSQSPKDVSLDMRPCWHVYDEWTSLQSGKQMKPGVYWLDKKPDGEGEVAVDRWICSPLHIDAQTSDKKGYNFGRILRFLDTKGHWKTWAMPMELLRGSGDELRGMLLSSGFVYDISAGKILNQYLMPSSAPSKRIQCALQTGWYDDRTYVLPNEVIGPRAQLVVFQSDQATYDEFGTAGSFPDWQEGVSLKAIGNPMLVLGLSCAFVGPLLAKTNSDGGGIHMVGNSSSGKSSIARAAASVWGGKSYARSWRMTGNGFEGAAALFNDGFLVLDEISQCEPSDIGEIAYSLGNGQGKQRANRSGAARAVVRWLTFALSNGERTIATAIREGGGRVKTGQSMRLLDLPTERKFGAWDDLQGFENGAKFADFLSSQSLENYGHAGRKFLEALCYDDQDLKERLNSIKSLECFQVREKDGQPRRAAGRFALIAFAGELATEYGITGWPQGTAAQAAALSFNLWRSQRQEGNEEKHKIFGALLDFIERHGDGRFSEISDNNPDRPVHNRAGYWEDSHGERTYLLIPAAMHEALEGYDFGPALDLLEKNGILPSANTKGERSQSVRVGKRNTRVYRIDLQRLQNYGQPFFPAQFEGM